MKKITIFFMECVYLYCLVVIHCPLARNHKKIFLFNINHNSANTPALGIIAASFFEARKKDIAESPTRQGNAQIKRFNVI